MSTNHPKQALIKVTGKVQGVFYRAHTQEKALELGLTGYARNMPDGSVEILAQGEHATIGSLIEWCKEGSPQATVADIKVDWQPAKEIFGEFRIR